MFCKLTPFLLALLLASCSAPSVQSPPLSSAASPTPASAATPQPSIAEASRIVALTSLSADILHRLDKDRLVGISGSRLLAQNPDLAKLPKVSEGRSQPNLEKIIALKPDLVIGAQGFHDQTLKKLQELGIRTLATEVNSWNGLQNLTRTLATVTKADATPLLNSYKTFLEPKPSHSASTLVLVSRKPIQSPNKTSWAGDFLAQFNAKNVVADLQANSPLQGYITLSPEKILEANPDVIIVVDTGDGVVEQFKSEPFWSQLRATQTNRVYVFDYYGLVNPGSLAAIETATTRLKAAIVKP
jgi:iron complex transport system substrate-binding protein